MGIAKIPPGEALHEHRHLQAEIYLILQGRGLLRIDGKPQPVTAGLRSSYRATPRTPARTRERRIYSSPTSFLRTRSRRSNTSSRSEPGLLPGRTTGAILEKSLGC